MLAVWVSAQTRNGPALSSRNGAAAVAAVRARRVTARRRARSSRDEKVFGR